MGQEIERSQFQEKDFAAYRERFGAESELLRQWFERQAFADCGEVAGFELEAWLVDRDYRPVPRNEEFLEAARNELVSPELSRFNIELNTEPQHLQGAALSDVQGRLQHTWEACRAVAEGLDSDLVMIGILPSVEEDQLTLVNMSAMKRYRALNEQVLRQRQGRPLELEIVGRERLSTRHRDVMLESATTSFQVHLQVPPERAVRLFNASVIASAVTVAVSANSPYLFGVDLWDETRIPLFEQAVEVGGFAGVAHGPLRRVSFGSGYIRASLWEPFCENLEHFPVLLPMLSDDPPERMRHVRLQNGTIWRWNRPLIGFEADGQPHLRIEHRVIPGGPTIVDLIANAALYYGLAQYLSLRPEAPERTLPFTRARDNFYKASRHGLDAGIVWLDGKTHPLRTLVLERLLEHAREGLDSLGIDAADSERYLGIIEHRVQSERNGCAWQRAFVKRYGRDFLALTRAYAQAQHSGAPVHEWSL